MIFLFFQIDQKPQHKSSQHENHVSQISKSIQLQTTSHVPHNHMHTHSNHANHESNHSPMSRGHGSSISQININNHQKNQRNSQHHSSQAQEWRKPEETSKSPEDGFYESGPVVNDGKHSLLQYAMLNFRQSTEKYVSLH